MLNYRIDTNLYILYSSSTFHFMVKIKCNIICFSEVTFTFKVPMPHVCISVVHVQYLCLFVCMQSVCCSTFTHGRGLEDVASTSIHHELGSVELHHPALCLVVQSN